MILACGNSLRVYIAIHVIQGTWDSESGYWQAQGSDMHKSGTGHIRTAKPVHGDRCCCKQSEWGSLLFTDPHGNTMRVNVYRKEYITGGKMLVWQPSGSTRKNMGMQAMSLATTRKQKLADAPVVPHAYCVRLAAVFLCTLRCGRAYNILRMDLFLASESGTSTWMVSLTVQVSLSITWMKAVCPGAMYSLTKSLSWPCLSRWL